jgi:hypothetical protein
MRTSRTAALLLALLVAVACAAGQGPTTPAVPVPPPPAAVAATTPAAQVAWLWLGTRPGVVGIDPGGRVVASVANAPNPYLTVRAPDGASFFLLSGAGVAVHDAATGQVVRTLGRPTADQVLDDSFSQDGRYLALLTGRLSAGMITTADASYGVEVLDLRSGAALPRLDLGAVAHGGMGWLRFAPDGRLYAFTGTGGVQRLSVVEVAAGAARVIAQAVAGRDGSRLPSCADPAPLAARFLPDGRTVAAFCHGDGSVWFVDLGRLSVTGQISAQAKNPFWDEPIFAPDGRTLYLHDVFSETITTIDLARRAVLATAPVPHAVASRGPLDWLGVTTAEAGGIATTVPVSPDGSRLYLARPDGVSVLRLPDLRPMATFLPGQRSGEVWVSGDGQTLFVLSGGGSRVDVLRADGTRVASVPMAGPAGGFVASAHG